jgi:protein TonB
MPVSPIEATARSSTVADHPVESEPDAADAEPDALGAGVGPGKTAGFGGGDYYRGGGITAIRIGEPTYTSEAMRAKIQGTVTLDVEVLENGTVGEVRVTKSLDRTHGLDQRAIEAAKQSLFRPPRDAEGRPVKAIVTLILDFRLY